MSFLSSERIDIFERNSVTYLQVQVSDTCDILKVMEKMMEILVNAISLLSFATEWICTYVEAARRKTYP